MTKSATHRAVPAGLLERSFRQNAQNEIATSQTED